MKSLAKAIVWCISISIILVGVEVQAADFCCVYYKGSAPDTNQCLVMNVQNFDKNSDQIPNVLQSSGGFSCSNYAENSIFYSTPDQGDDSYALAPGDIVAPNNLASATRDSKSSVNSGTPVNTACLSVPGYSTQLLVDGLNTANSQANKLCKLAEEGGKSNSEFQFAAQEEINKQSASLNKAATELENYVIQTASTLCCIPKNPDGTKKCIPPGADKSVVDVLAGAQSNNAQSAQNAAKAQVLLDAIKNGSLKPEELFDCADNDYVYYPVSCNSPQQIAPPSNAYKKQGLAPTAQSYCIETEGEAPPKDAPAKTPSTFDATVLNRLGTTDVKVYIGRIIKGVMGILGSITLVMFVYSGILFMTDRGNGENVGKAKETAVWTSLGLVLVFASYAILSFVFQIFGK